MTIRGGPSAALALVAMMAVGVDAHAQDAPLGSLLPHGSVQSPTRSTDSMHDNGALLPKGQGLSAARESSACMVRQYPAEVSAYLGTDATRDQNSGKWLKQGHLDNCLPRSAGDGELSLPSATRAGFLAEAWLRGHDWTTPAAEPGVRSSYEAFWMSQDGQRRIVDEMGACMAATQPQAVRQVILAEPGSREEKAAMSAVVSVLPSCFAKGAALHIDKPGLRLALALGLYHRVVDPAVPAAAINEKK